MTREYRTLVRCTADLELGVKMQLIRLGAKLVSAGLITPDENNEARNPYIPLDMRAADLVYLVQVKVQQDPKRFCVFIDILEEIGNNKYVHVGIPRYVCCCMHGDSGSYILCFPPNILVPRETRHRL